MHAELTYHDQVIMLGPDSPDGPHDVAGPRGLGMTLYLKPELEEFFPDVGAMGAESVTFIERT